MKIEKQLYLLILTSLFWLCYSWAGEEEALSLISSRRPAPDLLKSEIEAYEERESPLTPGDNLIYATLLMLEPGASNLKVQELVSSIRASSPETWLSDLANLLSLASFPSASSEDKIMEIERVIKEVDFSRILASEDPFVEIYKAKGLTEELGMDSLIVQLAYAYRDMKKFDKARKVSAAINNQETREDCLKQIDYFERKEMPKITELETTKEIVPQSDIVRTAMTDSPKQETVNPAIKGSAEIELVEEAPEESTNWLLWLIGALVVLGGLVVIVRRKS
jgi:hypothetical protein